MVRNCLTLELEETAAEWPSPRSQEERAKKKKEKKKKKH
jgi:hypothetical protein